MTLSRGSVSLDDEQLTIPSRLVVVVKGNVEVGAREIRMLRAREPL